MSLPKPTADAPVYVTGASSGIGAEIARGLGQRGYPLILIARRRDRLEKLAGEILRTCSVTADVMPLDLNSSPARAELIERLGDEPPAGLVNSAGFGTSGPFYSLPLEREREQLTINALALMELTHAALPTMISRRAGAVLNIASIAAFQPVPGSAVYAATKAFVQSFSEAVHEELRGTGVSCTALCPGPVPTEWWEVAGVPTKDGKQPVGLGMAQLSPQKVAEVGIAAMLAGKRLVVPGLASKMAGIGGRITPRRILLPALRIANSRS